MSAIRSKSRDNARRPMQWDASENAGFTNGIPWLPVNTNHIHINAEDAAADETSIFHHYRKLIALRKERKIVTDGAFELLLREDEHVFAYKRICDGEILYVLCNFTDRPIDLEDEELWTARTKGELLLSNEPIPSERQLSPYEASIYLIEESAILRVD